MKAIVNKTTNKVPYLFEDTDNVTLGETLVTDAFVASDINATDYEMVTVASGPSHWMGNCWTYDAGVWTLVDTSQIEEVTMRQARLALNDAGLLAQVETAIAASDAAAQIEWEYATTLKMDHPLTQAISTQLGLTQDQVIDLFIAAKGF